MPTRSMLNSLRAVRGLACSLYNVKGKTREFVILRMEMLSTKTAPKLSRKNIYFRSLSDVREYLYNFFVLLVSECRLGRQSIRVYQIARCTIFCATKGKKIVRVREGKNNFIIFFTSTSISKRETKSETGKNLNLKCEFAHWKIFKVEKTRLSTIKSSYI